MKRLFALFLCLTLLLSVLPGLPIHADWQISPVASRLGFTGEDGNDYYYSVYLAEDGYGAPYFAALEYVGYGDHDVTELIIPAYVPYKELQIPLRYISLPENSTGNYGALYHLSGTVKDTVRHVEIPGTVERICKQSFMYFEALTSVTFHEGLRSIGASAFFGAKRLTSAALPTTLETLEDGCFKGCADLVSVNFSALTSLRSIGTEAFCNAGVFEAELPEGLVSIGVHAFQGSQLREVSFPSTLQTMEYGCFQDCKQLQTVRFAEHMDPAFTTITGFAGCSALTECPIPNTVKTIAEQAFSQCGLTAVTIPASVSRIENKAFQNNGNLARLIILPGTTPLTIGPLAFYYCSALSDATITLPRRVTELQEGCFSYLWLIADEDKPSRSPIFYIYNENIRLVDNEDYTQQNWEGGLPAVIAGEQSAPDPWFKNYGIATVCYPETLTEETSPSFARYRDLCAAATDKLTHPLFSPFDASVPETCVVTGSVPEGATVAVASGGSLLEVVREGQRFTAEAAINVPLTVAIRLDGFEELTYEKTGAEFSTDWELGEITKDDFLSRLPNGTLTVNVTGALDANVAVLDAEGKLAVSGKATGSLFLAEALPAGTYTVLGFAANPYIDSISAETDLFALGIQNYGKTENVTLTRGAQTECTLAVPALELGAGVLEKSGVLLPQQQYAVGTEFTVRINYQMCAGCTADTVEFNVPAGLTVLSVASANETYTTETPIVPVAADAKTGVLSLRLRAEQAGRYTVGAAVVSGGIRVPLGSASFRAEELILELAETLVPDRDVAVTVYAAPNTEVTLRAGTGEPIRVKTNANGAYRGSVRLPEGAVGGLRTAVIASTEDSTALQSVRMAPAETRIEESFFVHADRVTYGYQDGKNVSGGYYTYVANGEEKNKYWTYSVTFEGSLLTDRVILNVYMMDGSVRHEDMTLASVENGETGYRQTYVATVYIEQAGDHVFSASLIPLGYDVTFTWQGRSFTLDASTVIYLRQLADAGYQQWNQDVEEIIADYGLEPGDSDTLFDYDSIAGEPWFEELPNDVQDAARALEQAIDESLETLLDVLDCDGSWDSYDSPEDLLEDMGIEWEENVPYDPEALENDGFTVSESDSDGSSYAFRETETDDGRTLEYRDSNGTRVSVDAQDNAVGNAGLSALGYTINVLSDSANDWLQAQGRIHADWLNSHPDAADRFNRLTRRTKVTGAVTGAAFGCFQAANNSQDYISAVEEYENLKGELENARIYQNYYKTHGYSDVCLWAIRDEIAAGERLLALLKSQKNFALWDTLIGAGFTVAGVIAALPSAGTSLAAVGTLNTVYDLLANSANLARGNQIVEKLVDYANARNQRFQRCGSLKHRGDCSYIVGMDPSGTVYEAVESNLLEGVTATCWDVTNDALWDSSPFDQSNPQITGTEGFYAWDVPAGDWRVDFVKDGYENASTEVVTVPPPQMGLKTGMIATAGPELLGVHAYPDYVELVFSQYMRLGGLSTPGFTRQWVDIEPVCEGSEIAYARTLHLIPAQPAQLGDTVEVTLTGAQNYAGKPLADYTGTLTVEPRPAQLTLNYEELVAVVLGEEPTPRLTCRVLDPDGQPLAGLTVVASGWNERFAEVTAICTVTDENGLAVFSVRGLLPGMTELTLAVEGTGLQRTLPLLICTQSNQVARPAARLGDTVVSAGAPKDNYLTVPAGTLLELRCETEGATIYYTVNEACPCQDTANRIAYTEPIRLTQSSFYRISAYKPGMEYSERLNLHITVIDNPFADVAASAYYYEPVLWAVAHEPQITNGTSATTFSPESVCTRGQIVTFLWRAKGCPEPESAENPFTDVTEGDYFYKAVLWAKENDVTTGTSETTFSPGKPCTRAQVVTFLWRAEGKPAPASSDNPFADVADGYYYEAVLWAVERGITNGTSADRFSPDSSCTRGQIVTFLYRDLQQRALPGRE